MHVKSSYGPWSVWANSSSVPYVQFDYVRWYHYLLEPFPLFACARTVRDYYHSIEMLLLITSCAQPLQWKLFWHLPAQSFGQLPI